MAVITGWTFLTFWPDELVRGRRTRIQKIRCPLPIQAVYYMKVEAAGAIAPARIDSKEET